MNRMKVIRVILLGLATLIQTGISATIHSIGELQQALDDVSHNGQRFDVTGNVCTYFPDYMGAWQYLISDGTNAYFVSEPLVHNLTTPGPHVFGLLDRIHVSGRLTIVENSLRAVFDKSECISRGNLNTIPDLNTDDLTSTQYLGRIVRLHGRIRNALRDDTDPNYIHMTLHDDKGLVHLMVMEPPQFPSEFISLIGADITATGLCVGNDDGLHRHFGPFLNISGLENVRVRTPPDNFASAPELDTLTDAHPRRISATGFHQVTGTVLAVWNKNAFLIQTSNGQLTRVHLQEGGAPRFGDNIRVLGLPTTDTFHLNLDHATWETSSATNTATTVAIDVNATDLMTNEHGFPQLMMKYYGKTIRLTGVVRYLPNATHSDATIQLESDGLALPVSAFLLAQISNDLEVGSLISVTGTCVIDINIPSFESGMSADIKLFIAPRSATDIIILSRPPWWTPFRLLCAIGALLFLLVGILVWNTMLRHLAERRGQVLADEQVKSVASELKVYERTHLAVELHDSLSQTLSGVSMQIDAVKRFAGTNLERMNQHLEIAAKTLKSCRDELRNCLLDLRSNALEEPDMNAAIRKTLEPYLDDADIAIRFFIPREIFSDNTAHTVLRIIRELIVNALRHGKADKIKVAGSIENNTLMFSVQDNGSGFTPDTAPGITEGHFGLQGIRERIDELGGTFMVSSTPGKGTKATITLPTEA